MNKPTAVLFDLGNVLVRLDLQRGLERLRRLSSLAPATPEAAELFFSDAALAYNQGTLTPSQFFSLLARQLGVGEERRAEIEAAWCDIFTPWPEMERLAEEVVAAGHPVYLLSNTDPVHFSHLLHRIPVLSRFTGLHLSYKVQLLKPNPTFFDAFLGWFGVSAERCAYIDDRPEHVAGAGTVGISGHVHTGDVAAVRAFLRERGVALAP